MVVHVKRALRINSSAVEAWQLLAQMRWQQGETVQAEVMAMRSNGFAFQNTALHRRSSEAERGKRKR